MRRNNLTHMQGLAGSTNAGLWLDKFYASKEAGASEDAQSKAELVQATARLGVATGYPAFFSRWKQSLAETGAHSKTAEVVTRMVVGLGNEAVIETSISLQRTYGVPMIPGSALKGLAAAYARRWLGAAWQSDQPNYCTVFGATTEAGFITFFDALPLPCEGEQLLQPDVLTPHHPQYYVGNAPQPPADWDSPTPVPLLTATGRYLIAVGGPPEWVAIVFAILEHALRDEGIGAKTSSGYGRMRLIDDNTTVELTVDQMSPPKQPPTTDLPPPPKKRGRLQAGDQFYGKVVRLREDYLEIEPQDADKQSFTIILPVEDAGSNANLHKKQIKVEVVRLSTRGDGQQIVEVKRIQGAGKKA